MQANPAHPDISQLNAFALGRLDPPEIDAVESHLAGCDTCCDALRQMKEDTFVGLVREAQADGRHEREPVLASLQEAATLPTSETPRAQGPRERAATADSDAATVAPSGDTAVPGDLPAEMMDHPRYHVLELLGVGGMGAVYKAEHRLMQRTVALKVINPKFIQSRQAVERFRREVQAAARLQHPNIVHAYDAEQAGNVHFLVMEYVKGTDLNQVLQERGPLPVHEACAYIRQAALGLQHAHEMGMVHRDIKPQNLMVTNEPARSASKAGAVVKILDFGLASLTSQAAEDGTVHEPTFESQKSGLTQAGTLMGTPDYMAPEQARDARSADIRSDIYSLGCTLYTLLAGAVPFPGGSAVDKVIAHASNPARPIREARGDVPPELAKVLDKMMAKASAERYQTPAEVADALASIAHTSTIPDHPTTDQATMAAPRLLQAPADALIGIGSMALACALGIIGLLSIAGGYRQEVAWQLRVMASSHGIYAAFIIAAGILMRRLRWRLLAVIAIAPVGLALPGMFAVNVIQEWGRVPLWPVLIPQWLGVPFCVWAILVLFRADVREAFAASAELAAGTTASRGAFRRRLTAALALAAGSLLLLAGVLYIRTDNGDLKIDCHVDDVRLVLSKSGQEFEVIDLKSGSTVKRVPSGHYDVKLQGTDSDVKLDKTGFTMSRGGVVVVTVTVTETARDAQIEAATRAAESWLSLLDAGDHGQAWESSAALSRKMLGKERAIQVYEQLATQLGKLKWRVLVRRDHTHSPPNLPPGDYVNVYYGSNFERMPQAMEVVSLTREKDGQWRPVGYGAVLWTLDPKEFPNGPLAIAPFDAAGAKRHQEAWAKHLGTDVEITNSLGMKLRLIPAGKLALHPKTSNRVDGSVNEVKEPFYAGVHEVTIEQFRQFVKETGYKTSAETDGAGGVKVLGGSRATSRDKAFVWSHPDFAADDDVPVAFMTWHDAMAFCRWLSKKEGRTYRLPTEVESLWQLRAGSPGRYFFGDNAAELDAYSWHSKPGMPLDRPRPVGQKRPNPWGLYDVHGNVGELCYEWLSLGDKPRLEVAPEGPGPNNALVQRGGGYSDEGDTGTGGTGWFRYPMSHIGFRVVLVGDLKVRTPTAVQAVQRFVGHNGKVIRVALSPSGHLLASTGEDNTVRVWDAKTGKQLHEFATKFTPVPVAISPDGELVAAIVCPGPFPDKAIVWQVKDGKKLFEFPMISGWTGCVAFSPDSRHVAWAEAFDHKAPDDAIRIVDARTGKEVRVIRSTKEVIANWTLAYSPDGTELACAGKDGILNVWDPATGKHLREIKGHTQQITRVDYSPDGKHIITGSLDKSVKVWNAKTGELVRSIDGRGAGIISTFSRDGRRLVAKAADHSLEVWDAFTDQRIATLPGHLMGLMHVVVSSDGKFVASGSFDNTARLWKMPEAAAQSVSAALQGHWKPVAVEQDGQPVPKEALNRIQFPMMFLFKDNRWGAVSPDGRRYESTFTLDAEKSPAWVDVKGSLFEGMPDLHGILKLEGDTVTVFVVEKDQPRPTAFTTKGKHGYMLIVARRLSETDAKIELATQAAEAWLKLVDAGDHGAAWEQSSGMVRQAVAKKAFVALYQQAAKKLGKLESRTVVGQQYLTKLPGAPTGDHVLLEYKISHENWSNIAQQVVVTLDQDGQWRVSQNVSFMRSIPPSERGFALAVRAGRGELSKEQLQNLAKEDHPLAALLADPGKKAILEWFASLPDGAHQHLLKEGYLKWKVASLDSQRQKALREGVKRGLEEANKLGVQLPPTQSLEALEKADTGFALVNVLGLKQSVVSWYLLFPASPQPGFWPVVGPKVHDPQAWQEAHLTDLTALRTRAYSKSIEEFAKADKAANETAKLQGTFTMKTLGDGANWAMTLDGAGRFRMTRNGQLGVEGSYKLTGDTIEFTDESGPFREQGSAGSGTYRWRMAGTKLIFDRLSDEARGRSTILLSNAWDKK